MAEFYCGRLSAPTPIKFQLLFLPTSLVNCAISAVRPREVSGVTNTVGRIDVFTPKAIHTSATGIVTINEASTLHCECTHRVCLPTCQPPLSLIPKRRGLEKPGRSGTVPTCAKGLDLGNAYCTSAPASLKAVTTLFLGCLTSPGADIYATLGEKCSISCLVIFRCYRGVESASSTIGNEVLFTGIL